MLTDPKEILARIYEAGCPTYTDNSGSLTRDGCAVCIFCNAIVEPIYVNGKLVERVDPHDDDCLWLKVQVVVRAEREAQAQTILLGAV